MIALAKRPARKRKARPVEFEPGDRVALVRPAPEFRRLRGVVHTVDGPMVGVTWEQGEGFYLRMFARDPRRLRAKPTTKSKSQRGGTP